MRRHRSMVLLSAGALALALVAAQTASAWRSPSNFEGSIGHIISAKDSQASREPDAATGPDGSLISVWSDQFKMVFARALPGQGPEFHDFIVSTIPGTAVPSGTAEDTSKPAVSIRADGKVAVAYLFNFAKSGGGNQHDVILITGQLDASPTGVTWDTPTPQRMTFSETDNAKRVSVAWDHAGQLHLAWEDAPDATPLLHVVRYMQVGSPDGPIVLSNLSRNATWPVLASDTGGPDRLHIAYTENGRVLERFAEAGASRVFGTPTLAVGSNASRPDLAILPPASGTGGGTPIVVFDGDSACGKRQVFAAAPVVGAVQLSDCTQTGNQEQATVAIRNSDRTVYATWLRESNPFNTVTGPMEESRLEANVGWRWWTPVEVVPTSEVAGGWFQPSSTATPTGVQVLALQLTAQFPSGQEIVHASNSQVDYDVQNVTIAPNPSGPGLKLSWTPFPNEAWHAIRILRKSTDSFSGPNDPTATVVGTLVTQLAVINGSYQVVPGGALPSTFTDTTADPAQSYVYKLYAIHRGPTPLTNFIQSPGFRFGTVAVWGSPPAPPALTPVPGAPPFELGVPTVTGFTITPGDTRVDLAWTNPATFDKITVVRKLDADPADPGDGTVLLDGNGTSLADTAVTNGLTYHYAIWVQRDGALSPPIRGNATPLPPGAPFTYTAQPAGLYSGTAPTYTLGAVFHVTQDKAILKVGKVFQAGSFAGSQVGIWEDGTGALIAIASVSPATPSYAFPAPVQLQAGKRYVIGIKEELGSPWSPTHLLGGLPGFLVIDDSAFASGAILTYPDQRDGKPGFSNEDWTMTFGPPDALPLVPPAPVSGFVALAGSARVDLSWVNPADFDTVTVVRKPGAIPSNPSDGTVVYTGTGTVLSDTAVTNGTTYGYAVWSIRRGEPTLFPGVATVTPALPAGSASYTSTPAGTYGLITATYTQGAAFHVTTDRTLLELGRIYQAGSGGPNQIGIWDASTQTLIFSTTVSSSAPKVALSTPIVLHAGTPYVIGVKETAGTPWSGSRTLTGLPSFLVIDDTAFVAGSTFSYPSGRDGTPGRSNEDWTMTFGIPGGLPVVNLRAYPGNARVDLSWTNPVDGGVIKVVRKAGTDPASPADGTLVYAGVSSTVTDTGLINGTAYHYGVWVARGPDLSSPAFVTATPSVPPVEGVRSLRLGAGDGRVELSWSNPTPDSIAAIGDSLTTGGSIDSVEVDQLHSSWAIGDDPAGGLVSHYERLLAVNPAIAGRAYNFARSGSKMSATLAAADQAVIVGASYVTIMSGANDVCVTPPEKMTSVSDFRTQLRATLNRLSTGLPNAKILVASIPDWTHLWALFGSDPTVRSVWQSIGRCPSMLGATATDSDRAAGRQRTIELNQVLAEECVATPNCRFDLNAVFNEQFTAADYTAIDYFHPSRSGQAKIAADEWEAGFWPDSATTQITVTRKAGSAPADPTDGTVVYTGTGNTAADTAVTNGTTYQYGVWLQRGGVLSPPVRGTAVPSTIVTYTIQPNGDFSRSTAGFTIGAVFHVTTAKTLVRLGRVYASGSSGGNQVGIWEDGTGTLLASAAITSLNPIAALATPLALVAGKKYVIGVQESSGTPWSGGRPISGLPPFLVVDDSAYAAGSGLVYPSGRDGQTVPPISLAEDWTITFAPPGTPAVPLPDPVSALVAMPGDGRADLSWSLPATAFDRVLVVRKAGAVPANPDDGTVAYSGTATALADTGLANGTQYSYAVWVQRGGDLSPAQVVATTPTGALPDPVTRLQVSAGDARVDLSWANPTSPYDQVIVVRKSGGVPLSPGDGTVVYTGTGTAFSDTGVANGTLYTYGVWVGRGLGVSSAVRATAMPAPAPVGAVTALVATPGDAQVALSWVNPASLDAVLVVRKLGGAPADPTDGAVVFNGKAAAFTDTGLVNGTPVYYGLWVTSGGRLSSPLRTSAVPAVPAPAAVSGLVATPGDRRVDLTWTNPVGAFDSVQVVRKADTPPTSPADGTLVFAGNTTFAADAGLTDGTLYHYAVWASRGGVLSPVARAQAIPADPALTVTYTAQPTGTFTGASPLYNLGVVFHVTQDKALLKIGRIYAPSSTVPNQIGIFDEATQVLLTSATVSVASPVVTLPMPLVLRAGKKYVLSVKESLGTPWSGGRLATGLPPFLVIDDAAYNQSATFSFPGQRDLIPGRTNEDWTMTFGPVGSVPVAPDPVMALQATAGDSRVDLTWTNPTTAFTTVTVVRKQGSAPIDPSDGVVVYSGTGTAASDVGLTNRIGYQYAVWTQSGDLLSLAARIAATPMGAPPDAVTGLTATPSDTQVFLTWTNPSGTFDSVIVQRKAGGPPSTPTDGTRIYTGTARAATDSGLANGTLYSYAVWVSRDGVLSNATGVTATPNASPLGPVTALQATGADLSVHLTWTNPTTPFDFIRIVRKPAVDPVDPTDGTVVYSGSGSMLDDTGLTNGTVYRYAVWAVLSGSYSAVTRAGATPAAGALLPVTGLSATPGNFRVDLAWTNPVGRIDLVKVVRKAGSTPATPADGTTVYSGLGTSVADLGLSNGTLYQYAIWVQRDGALSTPAVVGATPVDPAATVTYAATPTGAYTGAAANYNLGAVFHVTVSKVVLSLGRTYKAGSTAGNQIGVFDGTTGALLASVAVTPAAPVATLSTPLALLAGKSYVIGVKEATGSPWSSARLLTGLPAFLVIDDTAFGVASTFSYPNLRDNKPGQSNEDWVMSFGAVAPPPMPDPVTALAAVAGDTRVDLSWTNPATAFDNVVVVRKAGGVPADPTDGTTVYTGTASTLADTGLANGTTYGYAVWTSSLSVLSVPATASAMPLPPAPNPVTDLVATPGDGTASLVWTSPAGTYDDVRVVRKAGSAPTDPGDGTLVYTGTATAATDSGLVNGTTYHYAVWAERAGRLSTPARVTALPSLLTTYTTVPRGDFSHDPLGLAVGNLGTVFHVTQDRVLLELGRGYGSGSTGGNRIGIWEDGTGTLLASVSVDPLAPVAALPAPLPLTAGKKYVIAIQEAAGSKWSSPRQLVQLPSFLVVDDTAYNTDGTGFSYPQLRDNQSAPILVAEDWTMTFAPPGTPAVTMPDPVSGLQATAGDTHVTLTWTNPATAFDRVVVVRRTGNPPIDPTDGTTVYSGTATATTDTGLVNGMLYRYGVWVQRGSDTSAARLVSTTPTSIVPDPVTALQTTAADGRVDLAWTNPTSPFDNVLVVRKAGGAPTNPADGTQVYSGTGTAVSDTGLVNGTLYVYSVWVGRGTDLSAATLASATPTVLPASPVTGLQAVSGDSQVALSWTPPTVFDTVTVVRKAGGPPADPTDGITIFDGVGSVVVDTGLVNGTLYGYAVWTHRGTQLSAVARTSATPSVPPPAAVTGLSAVAGDARVDLTWTAPAGVYDAVVVVRKAGGPPADPTDGTTVYTGTGAAAADTGLVNGTTYYHYAVWTQRGTALSAPARAVTIPVDPATIVSYGMQPLGDFSRAVPGYMLGTVFHVTQEKLLLAVGRAYGTGSTGSNQIGIWEDGTGLLLASAVVAPGAGSATLDTPLLLSAGTRYVIGIKQSAGSPWSSPRVLTGLPSFLVLDDTAYLETTTFAYPSLRDHQTAPIRVADDWSMTFGSASGLPTAPAPVTGLTATPSDSRVDLTWSNPATAFDLVTVVRKTGSAPAGPTDGTVVYSGTGAAAADIGLVNGTTYYYGVWTQRAGLSSPAVQTSAVPVIVAPGPVTALLANPGDAQVLLSWANPPGFFDDVRVVRKAGSAPASATDGTVVYTGIGTSALDTPLVNGTLYYYAVWVERAGLSSSAVRTSSTPVPTPLDPVVGVTATPGDFSVALTWTNPSTPFDAIKVVRKTGSAPADPTDGTLVYSGTATSVTATGLVNGTLTYFGIWAQRSGLLSAPARVAATPTPPPLLPVTGLSATPSDSQVALSWTNPAGRFDFAVVVAKMGGVPADPTDGTTVYSGTGSSVTDTGLTNGLTRTYRVWVSRDGTLSTPAQAVATPLDQGSIIGYAVQPLGAYGSTAASYTAGAVFHVTDDKVLLALGRTYKAGSTAGNQIGIWDAATQTLLGSVSVSPASPSAALATPVVLTQGASYVIGIKEQTGSPWSASHVPTNLPGFLVIDDSAFVSSTTFAYPSGRDSKPGQTNDDWSMTFAAVGTVVPPAPVTGLTAAWNDTRNTLTWTNPAGKFDVIQVVRKAGADPVDPTDGTLVYSAAGSTVVDTGLTNGIAYHYGVWAVRGGKPSTAARVTSIPNVPVDAVTSFSASAGDLQASLAWVNPTTRFDTVKVIRKAGSAPADQSDGIQIYNGTGTTFVDTGLANGTAYYYVAWVERDGLLSPLARTSVTPVAPPLQPVTLLRAVASNHRVDLTWTNPPMRIDAVQLVRKAGSAPTGPADGLTVYTGPGTSFADTGLVNGANYYYAAWVLRDGALSARADDSATPFDASTFVTAAALPTGTYTGTSFGYTMGALFHLTDDRQVTALGRAYKNVGTVTPTPVANQIGIWDATAGSLLASATITQASPIAQLKNPITLHAGTRYVIGIKEETGTPWSAARAITGLPGFLVIDDTAFNAGTTFAYPAGRDGKPGQSNEDWVMTFAAVGDPAPGAPVTALAATAGDNQIALAWTNPAVYDFVKVVRKQGSVAPADPTDGTLVYSGTGDAVTDTGLADDTTYTYAVWTVRSGVLSVPATATATPFLPGLLSLSATLGDTKVDLAWTNPSVAFDRIRIVRKAGSPPASTSDGTTIYTGTGTSFSDTGLTNDVTYHYAAWVERGAVSSLPMRISSTPTFPNPNPVTGLTATPGDLRAALSWTAPTGVFDSIVVVRKAGATGPVDPTDGVTVYSGIGTSFLDTTVANGTSYQYAVWTLRGIKLSTPARVTATPVAPPLVGVAGLSAVGGNARVDLAWTNPAIRFDLVHVVRKAGSAPTGIVDGTEIYTGTGSSAADTGLTNGFTYYYAVYVERDGALSAPTRAAALTVDPATQVTYTSAPLGTYGGNLAGYTLGAVFHLTADKALLKLGRTYKAGSTAGNTIGIWDAATQTLLTSVAVTPAAPVVALAGPLQLQAGKQYVLGVQEAAGSPWSGAHLLTGLPGFLVVDDTAYAIGNGLLYPNGRDIRPGQSNEDWTMTFAPVGSVASPDPVTALTATPGDTTVALAWTNPTTPFDTVQVVRKAGGIPASPADGTTIYTGTGTSLSDTGLTDGTSYGYAVWTVSAGVISAPATVVATPAIPPVSSFVAAPSDTRVDLSWSNPAAPFDHILVLRKAAADPVDPSDGTTVYSGTGASVGDTGLTNGVSYHYAIWVQRGLLLSAPVRATATPAFGTPSPVTGLTATPGDLSVNLAWTNPTGTFDAVRVVRKAGADPADPSDGTVAYSGTGTSLADSGLVNGTSYHYGVWVVRGTNFSAVARATATPAAGTVSPVTGLAAVAGNATVSLSWTAPAGRVDAYLVTRKAGGDPATPADGIAVAGATATGVTDTGVANSVTYGYAVWAVRDGGLSPVARATATPLDPATIVTVAATPVGTYSGTAPTYVLGTVFHLTGDRLLLRLGKTFAPGSTAAEQIGIWDDVTHALLASATITPGSPVATLATPITLHSGTAYVLGIKEETGSPWSAARLLTGLPSFFVVDDTAFSATSAFDFPASRDGKPGQSNEDWTMSFAPLPGP